MNKISQSRFINRIFIPYLGEGMVIVSIIILGTRQTWAQKTMTNMVPTRYGLAMSLGNTYDPNKEIKFLLLSGFILYDYDQVWPHPAPQPLRFKVEYNLGSTIKPQNRVITSVGMQALYYLDNFASLRLRPYVEAGIGVIYTDFQIKGQGLRINFNPQAGIGTEFRTCTGPSFLATLRLHHVSNGELHKDNRGFNSVILLIGQLF